nr:hypothetical protein [Methylomarinum sp. Ch1-1]MDP4519794.1 hypothetical protein [Methylomarinum sp. Ch1-1]
MKDSGRGFSNGELPAIPNLDNKEGLGVFGEDVGSKDAAVKPPGMGLPST